MKNIVIVESPAKAKTIEKYLAGDYKVVSSKGHIRDLTTKGKYGLGVDLDNDFKPSYEVIKGKTKDVKELKKLVDSASHVYLATDPDREGEIISWHLKDELNIDDDKYDRVTFREITKDVVLKSINEPSKIDMNLVKGAETRRILDRIIGFRLSKLMQYKTGGKSAGRVQSVALKLIVDREREILAFVPKEYWTIEADFKDFTAELVKYKNEDIEINTELEADEIISKLSNSFTIDKIEEKEKLKQPKEVFKTSTLQQLASTKLNFAASKTMKIAQKLYEGIDLSKEIVGLITYMRTDSVRVSPEFVNATKKYISDTFGDNYVGIYKVAKKKDGVQDGHEGIRPTDIRKTPESIKSFLTPDEYKLYKLIYIRALASLMAPAKVKATTVTFLNNDYLFKTTGQILTFDGYLKVYGDYEESEDKLLPNFKDYKSNVIPASSINKYQHFTKPASRYTESSLIKELESLGIGRPSTYATIISTLKDHEYVKVEDKKFIPTEIGIETTDKLQEYFSDIINVSYTANMEQDLDEIAEAKKDNIKVLHEFYDKFAPIMDDALKNMEKKQPVSTGESCPNCGSDLVIRKGKFGEFVACSNYPTCKYIKKEEKKEEKNVVVAECPKCHKDIIERKTKKGKIFYGCTGFPKCNYATWYKPTGNICEKCGNLKVLKNNEEICENCAEN